jgi:excisionase family DNA binding protein
MKPLKGEIMLPKALVNRIVKKVVKKLQPILVAGQNQKEAEIMDVDDLAGYLQVPVGWIYKRTGSKEIPHMKLANRQLRFRKKDIDEWLESVKMPAVNHHKAEDERSKMHKHASVK